MSRLGSGQVHSGSTGVHVRNVLVCIRAQLSVLWGRVASNLPAARIHFTDDLRPK